MTTATAADREVGKEIVVALADITIDARHREDLGDITDLTESIADIGLINPITITSAYRLIAGGRRVAAYRALGRTHIQARVTDQFEDMIARLKAERDENVCRKEMTLTEKVALGRSLEEIERPDAERRQVEGARLGAALTNGTALGSRDPKAEAERAPRVRDIVAPAVGLSPASYARAKTIVTTAEDPAQPEEVRAVAKQAIADVEAGGSLRNATDKVAKAKEGASPKPKNKRGAADDPERLQRIRDLAADGHNSPQIGSELGVGEEYVRRLARDNNIDIPADRVSNRTRRIDSNRVVNQLVLTVAASVSGLDLVEFSALDGEQLTEWVTSLSESLGALSKFRKRLEKEVTDRG